MAKESQYLEAMNVDQSLRRYLPQPDEERHIRLLGIMSCPFRRVDIRLLKYVRRVDASLQATVQPELDHSPEPLLMKREKLRQRLFVPLSHLADKLVLKTGVTEH